MDGLNGTTLAIGGIALLPLIIGLIQFVKRFAPNAHGNVWLGAAFLLGVIGQVVVWIIAAEMPLEAWALADWAAIVVMGLSSGLAAGKAYDEVAARPESMAGRAVRGLGNE